MAFAGISFADSVNNDSISLAESLSPNAVISGSIGYEENSQSDQYDWYQVTLPLDGRLDVNLEINTIINDLKLFYINANGYASCVNHGYDSSDSDGYHVYGDNLAKGTYYIRIYMYQSAGEYTLNNTFISTTKLNDEPSNNTNDARDEADNLGINTSREGHIGYKTENGVSDQYDWYQVTLPSDGRLDVNLEINTIINDLKLFYINTNGYASCVNHGSDSSDLDGYHVYGDNLAKGTYYIKIYMYQSAGEYTLNNTFTSTTKSNDEPSNNTNDTKDEADNLGINTSKEGHIGYKTENGVSDQYDWYQVTLPSDGRLDVNLEINTIINDLKLFYINANGYASCVNYGSDSSDSDGYHVYGDDLTEGIYYIRIYMYQSADEYTLNNIFTSNTQVEVPVTDITLNKSSVETDIDSIVYLSTTILPTNATDQSVTWMSNDLTVATVSETGTVTAISSGNTTITAYSSNSEVLATCTVKVTNPIEDDDYDLWTTTQAESVESNKKWTISFNKAVDSAFVSNEYFYVKDPSGNIITDHVAFNNGKTTEVAVYAPINGYDAGQTYTLYIEGDILGTDGSYLLKAIKMYFSIETTQTAAEQDTLTHRGFDFSSGEFRTDNDSWEAEFDNRKDGAIIFWEPVEAGDEGRGEYVWIESPDEESKENIVADLGNVNFDSVTNISNAIFTHLSPALLPNHVYIVKTQEGGYAKIEVLSINSYQMTADVKWVYSSTGEF